MILLDAVIQYGHNHITPSVALTPNWINIHVQTLSSILQSHKCTTPVITDSVSFTSCYGRQTELDKCLNIHIISKQKLNTSTDHNIIDS